MSPTRTNDHIRPERRRSGRQPDIAQGVGQGEAVAVTPQANGSHPGLNSGRFPHTTTNRRTTSFGILSTYPPTQCGIATFSASLRRALGGMLPEPSVQIVRIVADGDEVAGPLMPGDDDGEAPRPSRLRKHQHHIVHELYAGPGTFGGPPRRKTTRGPGRAVLAAADALNGNDVAIIQHEFGIFGGHDGDQLLEILEHVRVPVISVMHTVLTEPTEHQRYVVESIVATSDSVITMSQTGMDRLVAGYDIDADKIRVVPHGAWPAGAAVRAGGNRRPVILSWGLIGPGKGLEWGVAGLPLLRGIDPLPRYVIAGQTHPKVFARDGDVYRDSLVARAIELGVADMLEFETGYIGHERLHELIREADVIMLPYDSHEQVTSGVLIEAVASVKPVVSTSFPHAVEMLGGGAGLLVPHRDPDALGSALRRVLTEPGLAETMSAHAASVAPAMHWAAVAREYHGIASSILKARVAR